MSSEKLGEIYVEINARTKNLEKQLKNVQSSAEKSALSIKEKFNQVFLFLGGAMLVRSAFQFLTYTKNLARDAEEIRSKFNQVFLSINKDANIMADNFAKSFGIAKSTARDLLAETGDLLVGFGFTEKEALKLSLSVNSLAQDLLSYKNYSGGAKGASLALTKALLGETESAKSLGIVIKQDSREFRQRVQQKMIERNITETQAKALVILEEAYKQSGKAVGDYNRTKESLANTERNFQEQIKEINEELGTHSATVLQSIITLLQDFGKNMGDASGSMSAFGLVLKSLATPIIIIFTMIKQLGNLIGTVGAGLVALLTGDFKGAARIASMGWDMMLKDSGAMNDALWKMWSDTKAKVDKLDFGENADKKVEIGKNWTVSGKTFAEIETRIDDLKKKLQTLTPGSVEATKVMSEIKSLTNYIESFSIDAEKFFPTIPEGYTAKQVAEFEQLKFALDGYYEYRKAVIDAQYKQEIEEAEGNKAKILKAEEDKILALERLNLEYKEYQSSLGEEIIRQTIENNEKLRADTIASYEAYKTAIEEYYNVLGALSTGYYEYRRSQINAEVESFLAATNDKVKAKELEIELIKRLDEEYLESQINQFKEKNQVFMAMMHSMEGAVMEAFSLMRIKVSTEASAMEKIFVNMANTFIAEVQRMIAQWLTFQLLKGIVGVVLAPFTGGASLAAAAIPGGHSGGTFIGTKDGVKKLAGGGSFIVPPGYPNDSYPLFVESGEKVSVTRASDVRKDIELLAQIDNSIKALTKTLWAKNTSPTIIANIDSLKFTESEVIPSMQALNRAGVKI